MTANSYPPRKLPTSVKIKLYLGVSLSQAGWLVAGFGMLTFWIFGANADYSSLRFNGQTTTQTGTVIESIELDYEINERSVYQVYYRFITPEGIEVEDYSYSTGTYYKMGKTANIEYPENNPSVSRIRGLRRSPFSLWLSLTALTPIIGGIMILIGFNRGHKASQLLSNGLLTTGKLTSKKATNTSINEERVYNLTFTFKDETSQVFTITEKTHKTEKLEDDTEERILYLRESPKEAVMFDSLPGEPEFDSAGNIMPHNAVKVFGSFILPILVLVGNGVYCYFEYFR